MPIDDSAPRVAKYRIQLREKGLKRIELLVHAEDEAAIRKYATRLTDRREKANPKHHTDRDRGGSS
jgi:hypothetical protein